MLLINLREEDICRWSHGDMKQRQRDQVMDRFRTGNVDILVATDVAARNRWDDGCGIYMMYSG